METAHLLTAIEADLDAVVTGRDEAEVSAAARLVTVLRTSLQLRVFDLMGEVALELSDQLPAGHVEVRLSGRDVELVYVSDEPDGDARVADDLDERGTARLTLRMPEGLKERVERAADHEGLSTNAWLVAAVKRGLDRRSRRVVGSRLTGYGRS